MKIKLTQQEAIEDFITWAKSQPSWKEISRYEKQCIYKARKAIRDGHEISLRLDRMFDKFAPGRYKRDVYYSINR